MKHQSSLPCKSLGLFCFFFIFSCSQSLIFGQTNPAQPNILFILVDDMGVDVSNGYQNNDRMPVTPHIDSLRSVGVTFMNAWAAPKCTPTRAAIMSGKYGNKTGVLASPGHLHSSHTSIFKALDTQTNNAYADAVIGKWHISQPEDPDHPMELGIDHFEGILSSGVANYYEWEKTNMDGSTSTETEYATSHLTNNAVSWINAQTQPWFLWLAHVAPHSPFHTPPSGMYTSSTNGSNKRNFITMIEAIDYDIGRLIDEVPKSVLSNTVIIFMGDNGTPSGVIQNFPSTHAKGTVYQGGAHVPLIVAGAGVSRQNSKENALVHATDLYATILELTGGSVPNGLNNSLSFKPLLTSTTGTKRPYNYTELNSDWTIRNEQYKLINFTDNTQEFYDLIADTLELNNLINTLSAEQQTIKNELESEGLKQRDSWSCNDSIQNGDETGRDCGGTYCVGCDGSPAPIYCTIEEAVITEESDPAISIFAKKSIVSDQPTGGEEDIIYQAGELICLEAGFEYTPTSGNLSIDIAACEEFGIDDSNCPNDNTTSTTNIGCCDSPTITNIYTETVSGDTRSITTNNFPNHDYCYPRPNAAPAPVNYNLMMDATPAVANNITSVLSETGQPQRHFGVALNGVIIAPAPATPFIFTNTATGEYNWGWVFEPTNNQGTGNDRVGLDCSSAHTGPQGYHYHGNPFQYVEGIQAGISTTNAPPAAPIQIGWAGDGFPILYRFGPDENGTLKELLPSYQLKYGNRPGDGISAPCGSYNGKYTNDYEYIASTGDLDECNGVERTITLSTAQGSETFSYFYVVTASFPQISRCLVGTPDVSFGDLTNDNLETFFAFSDNAETITAKELSVEEEHALANKQLDMQIMPNPTSDKVFVSFNGASGKTYQLDILNYQGQKIKELPVRYLNYEERIHFSFSLSAYPAGVYIVRLNEGDNILTKKIIKE